MSRYKCLQNWTADLNMYGLMTCFKNININNPNSASRHCMPTKTGGRKMVFFQGVDILSLPHTGVWSFVNAAEQNDCACWTFFLLKKKQHILCMGSTESTITKSVTKGSLQCHPGTDLYFFLLFIFFLSCPVFKQADSSDWMLNALKHPSNLFV